MKLDKGIWVPDKTILYPISNICAEIGRPYRAQGPQQAQIDIMLNGTRKHQTVEVAMRNHPAFVVNAEEFDADPWMLNTPAGIWDMRKAVMLPHGALMRMQTAVTPDLKGLEDYHRACPKWMAYLEFVADGRDYIIPFLQRWGAQHFIGEVLGVHFLFIHGLSGTGKTVYIDVCLRLGKSYGTPVSNRFFLRTDDKRTFELYQLFKKRMAIADETPKGATWDEMLLLTMHNGSELSAEGKGRAFIKFRNTATVTITGNHKPNFVTHAEESGIDRRLLMLTMNKKIADHMLDDTKFAEKLVAEEGPAILMWFMQGAYEGSQSLNQTGSFLGGLEEPFKQQAKEYRRASNPFLQWIDEKMELNPDEYVGAHEAFQSFVNYVREENNRFHISKQDFREGLTRATNSEVSYQRRTVNPDKGLLVYSGLTFRNHDGTPDFGGNVISLKKR